MKKLMLVMSLAAAVLIGANASGWDLRGSSTEKNISLEANSSVQMVWYVVRFDYNGTDVLAWSIHSRCSELLPCVETSVSVPAGRGYWIYETNHVAEK